MRLKHLLIEHSPYFVTTNIANAYPLFTDDTNARIVVTALLYLRQRGDFDLYSYVIMPDHLHLLLLPRQEKSVSEMMHSIKSFTAKEINKHMNRSGKVWQEDYYEHAVRGKADFDEKLIYIHNNPVKAGLVKTAEDYKYSSAYKEAYVDAYPYT